jgi:hypothetical protein
MYKYKKIKKIILGYFQIKNYFKKIYYTIISKAARHCKRNIHSAKYQE